MSKNSNFAREIRAEGGGELASEAQQKCARFHGLPDSEIYTTEYLYANLGHFLTSPSVQMSYMEAPFGTSSEMGHMGRSEVMAHGQVYYADSFRTHSFNVVSGLAG